MSTNLRRVFDRSILLARYRWEILRRTAEYRRDVAKLIREGGASFEWTEARFEKYCLREGGIIEPAWGPKAKPGARERYDGVRARYGLRIVIHPEVAISEREMAAYPILADTPARQPTVKKGAQPLLRRFARRGEDISTRTLQRIFAQSRVARGSFRLKVRRVRPTHFDRMLAVFDARVAGKTFPTIARALNLNVDQAKRGWRVARGLIQAWLDVESHIEACADCQSCLEGRRDRWCKAVELQYDLPHPGAVGRAVVPEKLDRLAARRRGNLPARRR